NRPNYYCTATVTPACEGVPPTETTIGTAVPVGAVAGISTLTCMTPEMRPAADPAYCTSAWTPPMVAVTGSSGLFSAESSGGMIEPSTPPGLVCPSPVM